MAEVEEHPLISQELTHTIPVGQDEHSLRADTASQPESDATAITRAVEEIKVWVDGNPSPHEDEKLWDDLVGQFEMGTDDIRAVFPDQDVSEEAAEMEKARRCFVGVVVRMVANRYVVYSQDMIHVGDKERDSSGILVHPYHDDSSDYSERLCGGCRKKIGPVKAIVYTYGSETRREQEVFHSFLCVFLRKYMEFIREAVGEVGSYDTGVQYFELVSKDGCKKKP